MSKARKPQKVEVYEFDGHRIEFFEKSHRYKLDGVWVPSVTTILGMFDKPGIPFWVQTIVTRNTARLFNRRHKTKALIYPGTPQAELLTGDDLFRDGDTYLEVLKALSLTFRDQSDKDAARGVAIHKIFEDWGEKQIIPNPSDYPKHVQPFLRSLAQFLVIEQPEVEQSETMLASLKHKFAGRCDAVVKLRRKSGQRIRADIKTSKRVYPKTNFVQLEFYEGADIEMHGDDAATDERAIVHLGGDGKYDPKHDLAFSTATYADALAYLDVYNRQQRMEKAYKSALRS